MNKQLQYLLFTVCLAIAGWLLFRQPLPRETAGSNTARIHPSPPLAEPLRLARAPEPPDNSPAPAPASVPLPRADPATAPPAGTIPAGPSTQVTVPARKAAPVSTPAGKPKPALQDPTARVALSFVGADPAAEAYWLEAIFDPSLPDREREDLMEDLNEDGLSDHRHPGPEDFPLILNRLALIEEIAPDADEFMLPHLWEAYKDLVNLASITQGAGSPVR